MLRGKVRLHKNGAFITHLAAGSHMDVRAEGEARIAQPDEGSLTFALPLKTH